MNINADKLRLIADRYETMGELEIFDIGANTYYKHNDDMLGPFKTKNTGSIVTEYLWYSEELGFILITPKGLKELPFPDGYSMKSDYKKVLIAISHDLTESIVHEYGIEEYNKLKAKLTETSFKIGINFIETKKSNIYSVKLQMGIRHNKYIGIWNNTDKKWIFKTEECEDIEFFNEYIKVVTSIEFVDSECKLIDYNGNIMLDGEYSDAKYMGYGVFKCRKKYKAYYELLDHSGKAIINRKYKDISIIPWSDTILTCFGANDEIDMFSIEHHELINKDYNIENCNFIQSENKYKAVVKGKRTLKDGTKEVFMTEINL